MDPAQLIPSPDAIPVAWGWFKVLLIVTFILHVLVMNTMLGGVVIAFFSGLGKKPAPAHDPLRKELSRRLPWAIALTVNLGVAPLLFIQVLYGQFIYTSAVLMAVFWLSIFILVMAAYYGVYLYYFKYQPPKGGRLWLLGAASLLLLAVAFFFSNNMTLMLRPQAWTAYFSQAGGSLLNLHDPVLVPRYLHMVLSGLAVGGLAIALWAEWRMRRGRPADRAWLDTGMKWFAVATLINFPVGFWFLFALPGRVLEMALTSHQAYLAILLASVIAGLASMIFGFSRQPRPAALATLITVVLMVLFRDFVRSAYLTPYFDPAKLPVTGQYSSLILFLVTFGVGLLVLAYLARLVLRGGKEARS